MKEKAYLVECVRRAWLMNLINFYGLLFILPYYMIIGGGAIYILVYVFIIVSLGALIVIKLSIYLTRKFRDNLMRAIEQKNILALAYNAFYGVTIPYVSLLFIPLIVTITMAVGLLEVNVYLRVFIVFTVVMILVILFTYRNIRIVSTNIDRILSYLRSTR